MCGAKIKDMAKAPPVIDVTNGRLLTGEFFCSDDCREKYIRKGFNLKKHTERMDQIRKKRGAPRRFSSDYHKGLREQVQKSRSKSKMLERGLDLIKMETSDFAEELKKSLGDAVKPSIEKLRKDLHKQADASEAEILNHVIAEIKHVREGFRLSKLPGLIDDQIKVAEEKKKRDKGNFRSGII